MIVENAATAAPGNSAQSTAHRARALMAEFSHLADMPFGKVVSGLANGSLELTPPAAVPPSGDGQEIAAPSDEGDGAEPPADPADPVEIVTDDPVPEGGQPQPAEGTITEGATATIDEAPGESTAAKDEALGDPHIDVDLVALFDTDEEIVEIVAVIAMFGWLNRWNDTMATTLEEHPLHFAEQTLTERTGWEPWEAGAHAPEARAGP